MAVDESAVRCLKFAQPILPLLKIAKVYRSLPLLSTDLCSLLTYNHVLMSRSPRYLELKVPFEIG